MQKCRGQRATYLEKLIQQRLHTDSLPPPPHCRVASSEDANLFIAHWVELEGYFLVWYPLIRVRMKTFQELLNHFLMVSFNILFTIHQSLASNPANEAGTIRVFFTYYVP